MSSFGQWIRKKIGIGQPLMEARWVDPRDLKVSGIRHEQLTGLQMQRIERLCNTFSGALDMPLDTWITNFKGDMHPDRELAVWEWMASAYDRYTSGKDLSREALGDVLHVVLQRSGCSSVDEVVEHLDLKILSHNDAREMMAGFY